MTEPVGFAGGSDKPKKKARKPGRKLSALKPREARVVQGIVDGKSARRAALDAGCPESMANSATTKVLTPAVRAAIREEMERQGLTDEFLVKRIGEGISAQVVKIATHEGMITDERAYVDFDQRGKYIDRALELKGHIRRGGGDTQVNIPIALFHGIPRPTEANGHVANGNGQVNGNGHNGH